MKTSTQAAQPVCWTLAWFIDPDLLATHAIFLAVLACGGVALWLTVRWYRTLKLPTTIKGDALAQLNQTVDEHGEIAPEERQRIQEAIERQRKESR